MDERQRAGLAEIIPYGIAFDFPMDKMTTYLVGGSAEVVCYPGELSALCRVVSYLGREEIPYVTVGKGSNLLVADKGVKGVVIVLKDRLASVEAVGDEGNMILAGGGLTIVDLLGYCRRIGLSGLEFMAGIPGTLGGAVIMNAGAYGQEIGKLVQEVLAVKADGEPAVIGREDMRFSYRSSSIPGGAVIYGASLRLHCGDRDSIGELIAHNLKKRKEAQPLDYPSAGSVFKNPPGDYAGRLIEKAGLKGTRIGGAMISPRHGNFIVNTGTATASDILGLINLARDRVKEETGISLETEIVMLGD